MLGNSSTILDLVRHPLVNGFGYFHFRESTQGHNEWFEALFFGQRIRLSITLEEQGNNWKREHDLRKFTKMPHGAKLATTIRIKLSKIE